MAELSSDVMRGYNDVIVLSVLAEGDSYGYEISRRISERSDGRYPIKETTLYSAFARLERSGLISSYVGSETFGRQRTYYTMTDSGRKYFLEKCDEWRLAKEVIDSFIGKITE
jgi:Predicted transcriptional regulators